MKLRLHSLIRSAALLMAAAALVVGVTEAPTARADDQLNFTGTTLSGATFNGASLQGKPAVMWFWTPWCPFCNQEAPSVSAVAAANPKVTFVGVAARSDVGQMAELRVEVQPELHQSQRRRRIDLGPVQRSVAAGVRVPRPDGTSTFVNNPTSAMSQQELTDRVRALAS